MKSSSPVVCRTPVTQVLIDARGGRGVEFFASGTLADEVHVLDHVSGRRIAIAAAVHRTKYRKEWRPCLS
jgi:hypothetical protein